MFTNGKWLLLILLLISSVSRAETAACSIEIRDHNAALKQKKLVKYHVGLEFDFEPGANALTDMQRKYFTLPNGHYHCTLAFLDMAAGTSLSCEKKKDQGYTYVQAEQSSMGVNGGANHLSFRDEESHLTISVSCSSKGLEK